MKSALALLGAGVRANIVAGTRLAMFLKVSPLDFRNSAGQFAALATVSLLFWAGGARPDAQRQRHQVEDRGDLGLLFGGGFIEPLKDDHTLILTAADASHQSFGCEYDSDFAWFSKAYFDQALRRSYSFTEAFGRARTAIAEREKSRGLAGSNPQMHVGAAMREKIESLAKRFEALDAVRPGIRAGL